MILTLESEAVEQLTNAVTTAVMTKLEIKFADVRWVKATDYAKYYGISNTTLWRKEKDLRKAGALLGKGKQRRFDKFHNPLKINLTAQKGKE